MALRNTSTVLLSISVLMASTGLAQAGFIWLAPEQSTTNSSTYSRQAEPPVADETQLQGRQWPVDSAVPVVGTQPQTNMDTAAMAPAPLAPSAEAQTLVSPPGVAPVVEASVQAPAPVPVEQVQAAPVQVAAAQAAPVLLKNETVSGSPMVSPGDQPISAPVAAPAPAVESAPAAMSTFTAAPAQPEVTLGSARSDSAVVQQPATPGMPTAENLINSMPSMTSPTPAATPAPASVEAAPAMLTPVTAPTPAPAASLATAEPLIPPPGVAAPAPVSTSVASGNAVSLVTGENVATQAPASAPVVPAAKVIDGFGKQVPLVIAMRQILPSDYGFAHRDGVDLGQLIDWQGGRPWPQVLSEALAPVGVKVTISGDTVLLEKGVVAAAVAQAPAQEAPRARLTDTTIVQTR